MLYIPHPTSNDLNEYCDLIIPEIIELRAKLPEHHLCHELFNDKEIKKILLVKPEKMMTLNERVMKKVIKGFKSAEFDIFYGMKAKKNKTEADKILVTKYEHYSKVLDVFNYEDIISFNKPNSYFLANKLGRNTCTYCNRLYTNTISCIIEDRQGKRGKLKPMNLNIARAQFDHWFSKGRYPLLSLSYFNLIPSCGICNQTKSAKNFQRSSHVHPYIKENSEEFVFNYNHVDLKMLNVHITGATTKINNNLRDLKIQEVYDVHSPLELKDLLDLRYKYSENYIKMLIYNTFPGLKLDEVEAKRLIFGIESKPNEYHKRPFSKFKNDILGNLEKD